MIYFIHIFLLSIWILAIFCFFSLFYSIFHSLFLFSVYFSMYVSLIFTLYTLRRYTLFVTPDVSKNVQRTRIITHSFLTRQITWSFLIENKLFPHYEAQAYSKSKYIYSMLIHFLCKYKWFYSCNSDLEQVKIVWCYFLYGYCL